MVRINHSFPLELGRWPLSSQFLRAWRFGGGKFVLHTGSRSLASPAVFAEATMGPKLGTISWKGKTARRTSQRGGCWENKIKAEGHSQTHSYLPFLTFCSTSGRVSAKDYPKPWQIYKSLLPFGALAYRIHLAANNKAAYTTEYKLAACLGEHATS